MPNAPDDRGAPLPEPATRSGQGAYEVLAGQARAELTVERSRFLAEAVPAPDADAARESVLSAQRVHHDARHVCWGWRGGAGATLRELRSDGGEPGGTAGEPILNALRRLNLTNAVVTVARWFGGVKLGTGRLARAYAACAAAALADAPRRVVVPGREAQLACSYPLEKTVARLVAEHGGRVVAQEYGVLVSWRVWLPESTREIFASRLADITAGAVRLVD